MAVKGAKGSSPGFMSTSKICLTGMTFHKNDFQKLAQFNNTY